jgi:CMP-N,N'-diacetyllegionaminic acid synthase
MSVLAVIPARMGSARLPRKNLLDIEPGLSLVQQAIDCATGSGLVDEVVVTTDETTLPIRNAHIRVRPAEISGPTADIADAVHDAWMFGTWGVRHDWIVTLQPAVLARSPLIVRTMIAECMASQCSAITMAHTVPWIWQHDPDDTDTVIRTAYLPWLHDGTYPRSQDSPEHFAEVNAVTVAPARAVEQRCRWSLPLKIASLPAWTIALDIDNPGDMATARGLWPWAKRELETWTPRFHRVDALTGIAGAA